MSEAYTAIEVKVEQAIGVKNKKEIEAYGIDCQQNE